MQNAHERFGTLEYTKRMKDTTTRIRLRLDRFIGETDGERNSSRAHLVSVLGGDSDIGAIGAAIHEQSLFTVRGPGVEPMTATLGEGAQCFRGSISIAGRKPIRHLIATSAEMAQTRPGADLEGNRTVLCDDDPVFVLYRLSQRFGLPVVPEWADWFRAELVRRQAIKGLVGLGCTPALVTGRKSQFLKWFGVALRRKQIRFPESNGPVQWPTTRSFFCVGVTEPEASSSMEEIS